MRTLAIDASDEEIRNLVVEWHELLAQRRYAEALELLQIIAGISVDRENLYGLDPVEYLGMVHFDDVPLSGFRSDLTARFQIKRIGSDRLTLEFLDLHVM